MQFGTDRSDWWYGVAVPVVCAIVGRSWMALIDAVEPSGQSTTVLLTAAPAFATFIAVGLTPVFVYSMYKDVRALRSASVPWTPNLVLWAGGSLSILAGGIAYTVTIGDLFPFDLLFAPLGLAYLYNRRTRAIEIPTYAEDESDTTVEDVKQSDAESGDKAESASIDSKWWYGVAAPVVLFLLGLAISLGSLFLIPASSQLPTGSGGSVNTFMTLSLGGILIAIVLMFFLVPIYALSLYKDAKAVEASDEEWSPSRFYLGAAGIHLLGLFPPFVPLVSLVTIPAGGYYLYQRREYVGTP